MTVSLRIYPVPLKPASPIRTWDDWPHDVRDTLRRWNKGGMRPNGTRRSRLSFYGHAVFKCPDCERFCEPQPHGSAVLNGNSICDDCLIDRARNVEC